MVVSEIFRKELKKSKHGYSSSRLKENEAEVRKNNLLVRVLMPTIFSRCKLVNKQINKTELSKTECKAINLYFAQQSFKNKFR